MSGSVHLIEWKVQTLAQRDLTPVLFSQIGYLCYVSSLGVSYVATKAGQDVSIWEPATTTPEDHNSLLGIGPNDHHTELHTVLSHSDTTATGAELDSLTDGANADALHAHASPPHAMATHVDTVATGAQVDQVTQGSNADARHDHVSISQEIADHSDTAATGAQLDQLVAGANTALHSHLPDPFTAVSTGDHTGGVVAVATATTVDVADGVGSVTDWTDPSDPVVIPVPFGPFPGESMPDIGNDDVTTFAVNAVGALVKFGGVATPQQERTLIILDTALHLNHVGISGMANTVRQGYEVPTGLYDWIHGAGAIVEGSDISPNGANLQLNKAPGVFVFPNANFRTDPQNSARRSSPGQEPIASWNYSYRNGSGGHTWVTGASAVDPNQLDLGGGALSPVTNGRWTCQRLYIAPLNDEIFVPYGQAEYNSEAEALGAVYDERPIVPQLLEDLNAVYVAAVIVKKDAISLIGSDATIYDTINDTIDGGQAQITASQIIPAPISNVTSGIGQGLDVAINGGDPSTFDVAGGEGLAIDWSVFNRPAWTAVLWEAQAAITADHLATASRTGLYIDANGDLQQVAGDLSPAQRRLGIPLRGLDHPDNVTITGILPSAVSAYEGTDGMIDYARANGPINEGNGVSANGANLNLDKAVGSTTWPNIYLHVDVTQPATRPDPAASPLASFIYRYRDGSGGWTDLVATAIDPNNWDDGTGALNPVTNNHHTVQGVYFEGERGRYVIYPGQNEYTSLDGAMEGAHNYAFRDPALKNRATLIAVLVIEEGTLALTDATFLPE